MATSESCCRYQKAASSTSRSTSGCLTRACISQFAFQLFKPLAGHGHCEARIGIEIIAAAENLGLHRRADFVFVVRLKDFIFVPIKPIGKLAALLARQAQEVLGKLIHTHGS